MKREIVWQPSVRIIPSCFPPIQLFENVADPGDLDAVFELESMTNPRLYEEVGNLDRVPVCERVSGPGSSFIMAAFTHLNPTGSRFSNGLFGIYYAANNRETAIAETLYHQVKHLKETNEPAQDLDMRVLYTDVNAIMLSLNVIEHAPFLDPERYEDSQGLGRHVKAKGMDGIHYPSVRWSGGECVAVFRPSCLSHCRQAMHLGYPWNGRDIPLDRVYEKSALH